MRAEHRDPGGLARLADRRAERVGTGAGEQARLRVAILARPELLFESAAVFSDATRRYSTLGWALARADGKRPLGNGWQQAAPAEPGFAAGQWARWGKRWNLGVVLGPSGLAVVEFDNDRAGETLIRLLDHTLPLTPIVQSGSGRLRLYFRDDEIAHATRDGLELRTGAHFMVLPPSVHPNGTPYKWLVDPETELAALPAAVLDHFTAGGARNGSAPPVAAAIPNGERNSTLTSLAGTMRRRGLGEAAILAALRETPCETPLPEQELIAIARSVSRYKPREQPHDEPRIEWQPLSELVMRSIVFADKPLLQADAFHLLVGRKGMGKGTLLAEIAARTTRGELGEHRNVVWIGSEDSAEIDIKPRIVAADGDPARILIVKRGWVQLPRDLDEIDQAMTGLGEVGMLAIDPVGNHIAGKSSDSETDIRDAIAPLNRLANDHHSMVFGVRHLTEKECRRGILAAILGSSAWVQVPRAVLAVARDPDDPEVSHVQCVAGNRPPHGTPGRMFRIDGVLLTGLENEVTRAVWIGDSTKVSRRYSPTEPANSRRGARKRAN